MTAPSDGILAQLTGSFRGLRAQDAILISLQLVAWVHLSIAGKLPPHLALDSIQKRRGPDLAKIFHDLSLEKSLGDDASAFAFLEGVIRQVDDASLVKSIDLALQIARGGFSAKIANEAVQALEGFPIGVTGIPDEVAELMVALAGVKKGARIYCPFDESLQLSLAVTRREAQAFAELTQSSPLPWLLKLLSDLPATIVNSDPISKPTFVGQGKLDQFDASITFPPLGWRREYAADLFNRFPEKTTSGTVLSIRHALAHSRGPTVVAVPNSLLFSTGAERALRAALIEQKRLEAVIALPPALLVGTSVPISVLVLRQDESRKHIRFVDGSSSEFHTRDGRGRTALTGWKKLVEAARDRHDNEFARSVTTGTVAENDFNWTVSRYCVSDDVLALDSLLASRKIVKLEELAEIHRPATPSKKPGIAAMEVTASNIPDIGFLNAPDKIIQLDERAAGNDAQFLRPSDILITIKGSAGKVGIAPPDTPTVGKRWVCGQSSLIFRVKPESGVTALALCVYLKSDIGQRLLKQLITGATIPMIQLTELRKLPVILPTKEELAAAEKVFEGQIALQEQIEHARTGQTKLANSLWGLAGGRASRA